MTMNDFADCPRAAGVGSVMCAYNLVNNSYASQNSYLINKLLKDELGFQGFVMSDWSGQHTGVASALAGLDMTMPGDLYTGSGTSFWGSNLTISVVNGTVPEWRIDDMAVRIMSAFYKVGRDHAQVPINFDAWTTDEYSYLHYLVSEGYQQVNSYVDVQSDHKDLIRKIGSSSIVLLKNTNNALPLTGNEKFTAIIGEDASANPNGPNSCVDRGCDTGTLAMGWGSGTADFPYLITPEQAIQSTLADKGRSTEDYGSATNNYDLASIEDLAAQARYVLHFIVLNRVCGTNTRKASQSFSPMLTPEKHTSLSMATPEIARTSLSGRTVMPSSKLQRAAARTQSSFCTPSAPSR